jgi:hypothetical protein
MSQDARKLVEARLRDDAIRTDYYDAGIGAEIFEFVKKKGYRVVRLERVVERTDISFFICEFESSDRERRFKMSIKILDSERFDIKLDNLIDNKSRKLLGEQQHAIQLLKVYT